MFKLKDTNLLHEQAYINSQWVGADSGEKISVLNSSTQKAIIEEYLEIKYLCMGGVE